MDRLDPQGAAISCRYSAVQSRRCLDCPGIAWNEHECRKMVDQYQSGTEGMAMSATVGD